MLFELNKLIYKKYENKNENFICFLSFKITEYSKKCEF